MSAPHTLSSAAQRRPQAPPSAASPNDLPSSSPPRDIASLIEDVLSGSRGPDPRDLLVASVFWLHHTTRLDGAGPTYRNHYVLVRLGGSFGACAFEDGELGADVCARSSGRPIAELLTDAPLPVRIAALDAYLAEAHPHRGSDARPVTLPSGTPEVRARARDAAVADLLDIDAGARVALIGVVNPLVAAIKAKGGVCLPCDLNLRSTQWGEPVASDMAQVLDGADAVVATGMTMSNGTFDVLLDHARRTGAPLVVYGQTGSAVARSFLSAGVHALAAEPFPFSQFSAEETTMYCYRAATGSGSAGPNSEPTR